VTVTVSSRRFRGRCWLVPKNREISGPEAIRWHGIVRIIDLAHGHGLFILATYHGGK
jgi:hypothetical protein